MNDYIADLFVRITKSDEFTRKNAIVALAIILEHNSIQGPHSWSGGDFIPPIKEVKFDRNEEQEVVDNIISLLNSGLHDPSLVWALGNSHVKIGLNRLLDFVDKNGRSFDEEMQRQTIFALDHYLCGPVYKAADWRRRELRLHPELLQLIGKWYGETAGTDLRGHIGRLREKILHLQ